MRSMMSMQLNSNNDSKVSFGFSNTEITGGLNKNRFRGGRCGGGRECLGPFALRGK